MQLLSEEFKDFPWNAIKAIEFYGRLFAWTNRQTPWVLQRDQIKKQGHPVKDGPVQSQARFFSAACLQTAVQHLQATLCYFAAAIAGSKGQSGSGH